MSRSLRIALWGIGATFGLIAAVSGLLAAKRWYHHNYKTELQRVQVPARGVELILMADRSGFEDPAWCVYEVPAGSKPPRTIAVAHNCSQGILWNFDEAHQLTDDAELTVIDDRFVVFSRGGLRFSLYDMEARAALVNDISPWHTYSLAGGDARYGADGHRAWVRDTIERKIDEQLARAREPEVVHER
jgi:hypothetical protein